LRRTAAFAAILLSAPELSAMTEPSYLSARIRLGALVCLAALSACTSEGAPASGSRGAALVARSPWCVEHKCKAETPFPLTSGGANHPFSLPASESALVEAQTRDSVLIGAGLMLWRVGHTAGPKTVASLASFASGIVGDCPAARQQIAAQHDVAADDVMKPAPVTCGEWDVRSGRMPNGFFVSVDRRR
jgi:hypothetical protein